MNPKIFNQGDVRWGGLGYKSLPYTVKSEGCGLCAVTHCAIELPKYWNYTPKDTIGFMRTYATNGNGTEWLGIDKGLEKYLRNFKRHYSLSSLWSEVEKGNRVGVILFGSGTAPDGTVWTLGGHYVAFVDYKYESNQHWLYMKDSSYRQLSGWRSYERSMKGCIPDVMWTAEKMDGWKNDNGWHYYENGKKVTNAWREDSKGWCYLDSNGDLLKNGWAQDKTKKWFYLGSDGRMVKSKWVRYKDNWYYLGDDGAMVTNQWVKDSKGWCYLGSDGKQVLGSWVTWKSNVYYLDGKGYMVTGERNVPCTFDSKGKLVTE